jgi:hypothetical protein
MVHSETSFSKGDQRTRRYVVVLGPRGTKRKAINFIREVQAIIFEIAHRVITHTPTAVTSQLGTRGMLAERLVRFVPAVVPQVAHQNEVDAFTAFPTLESGKEGRVGEASVSASMRESRGETLPVTGVWPGSGHALTCCLAKQSLSVWQERKACVR